MANRIQSTSAFYLNPGATTTSEIDTTSGNFLVIGVVWQNNSTPPVITDTYNNNWNLIGTVRQVESSFQAHIGLWYAENINGGIDHTFTSTKLSGFSSVFVAEYSGILPSLSLDQNNGNSLDTSNPITSGSITTTSNEQVLIGFAGFSSTGISVFSPNNSFSSVEEIGDPLYWTGILADRFVNSTGNYEFSVNATNISSGAGIIASFKSQVAVSPTPTPTPTPTPSISITPSITPTITPSITPSITPTISLTPSITPSITPSVTPSVTPIIPSPGKVFFDGPNKLIIVNFGEIELDVKIDLYSAYKEWLLIGDNTKYLLALSAIGGDPIGPGRFLGTTFFLENGWKIRPYEGNHTLTVIGNLFSRDGSSPFIPTLGNFNVTINLSTSNLVDTISTGGGGSCPTAPQIATEVWNRNSALHNTPGTFGNVVNSTNTTVATIATAVAILDSRAISIESKVDGIDLKVDLVDDKIDNVADDVSDVLTGVNQILTNLSVATDLINTLLKYSRNRTKVDNIARTLTVYDDDGVTPIRVFSLKNFVGASSVEEIAERAPI